MIQKIKNLMYKLNRRRLKFGPVTSLDDFFDRIVFLNLDRRPDRLADIVAQASALNFTATKQQAVDGSDPKIKAKFLRYATAHDSRILADPTTTTNPTEPDDSLLDHAKRVRQEERLLGEASIQSAGAFAYLETQIIILEEAIAAGVKSILLLDDDVLFHNDFMELFNNCISDLPSDWKILQLGTIRYEWRRKNTHYFSPQLLHQGRSIGSHAVGLSGDVLPELLKLVQELDAPFDIGALSTLACRHKSRSFVCIPQLCIQAFEDTDIQSPDKEHFTDPAKIFRRIKWKRKDFLKL